MPRPDTGQPRGGGDPGSMDSKFLGSLTRPSTAQGVARAAGGDGMQVVVAATVHRQRTVEGLVQTVNPACPTHLDLMFESKHLLHTRPCVRGLHFQA
jgi:hypothetical protein